MAIPSLLPGTGAHDLIWASGRKSAESFLKVKKEHNLISSFGHCLDMVRGSGAGLRTQPLSRMTGQKDGKNWVLDDIIEGMNQPTLEYRNSWYMRFFISLTNLN